MPKMALENLLSQMGMGAKQLTDRYSEYGPPAQDQHAYYAYEQSQPVQTASPKHHHSSGGGLKSNASMSALTLLAFLFFLHILQQCIKDHMTEMSTAPVMVMTAGREGEVALPNSASKIDKAGQQSKVENEKKHFKIENTEMRKPYQKNIGDKMTKINAAEHKPRDDYEYVYRHADRSSFPGFVSAMGEKK